MDQRRYSKLIVYKSALDNAWKRRNPVGITYDEYEQTLTQVKMDKFKVMRNANGDHKLIDMLEEGKEDFTDMFNSLFGGVFNK